MNSSNRIHCLLLFLVVNIIFNTTVLSNKSADSPSMYPFNCSGRILACQSYLYHISTGGLTQGEIASAYLVNTSQLKPITHGDKQDYLVPVTCSCTVVDGTSGYFCETVYGVQFVTTYGDLNDKFYSGQDWEAAGEEKLLLPGDSVTMHLLCGCINDDSEVIVTYTVQERDSLSNIAQQLSANMSEIQRMNHKLIKDPDFIEVGWVLFVPMEMNGTQSQQAPPIQVKSSEQEAPPVHDMPSVVANVQAYIGKVHNLPIIIVAASAAAAVPIIMLIIFLLRKKKGTKIPDKDPTDSFTELPRKVSRKDSFMQYKILVGTPGYIAPESVRELQMTSKSDVFAFGVVLAELITGQPLCNWKQMADISERCLSDDPADRPDMREVVQMLTQILTTSVEWEAASPGGNGEELTWLLKRR